MRLSAWQAATPHRDSMVAKVLGPVHEALELLGAGPDPECWIAWGDDPAIRWAVLAPTAAGLVQVNVRVNVPGEGPRAAGKLTRWQRVQIGELSVEIQGGHRMLTFQVESQLIHAADTTADAASAFAAALFAAMDGRAVVPATADVIELSGPREARS